MAALLDWLAFDGARTSTGAAVASGKAWFYQPGTTATQVTVFSDADGLYALTQPVSLDAGGRAVVYTDRIVQVEVQTAAGATVRLSDRANAVQAAQVEIQNTVATGTSLTTGSQVEGGRTDLNAFLSSLRSSAGAPDGLVKVGAAGNLRLQDALHPLARIYDVTASPYNAIGDDATDATNAVTTAIAAAVANGGGTIYFPPGTYKFSPAASTAAIGISAATLRFLGAGPRASKLKVYGTSSQRLLQLDAGATSFVAENLGFVEDSVVGTTCILIHAPTASTLGRFINCAVTKSQTAGYGIKFDDGELQFADCEMTHPSGSTNPFLGADQANPAGGITVSGGKITYAGTATQGFCYTHTGGYIHFSNVVVSYTRASSSDIFLYHDIGTGQVLVSGCRFSTAGGTLHMNGIGSHTSFLTESGCVFGSNVIFKDAPVSSTVREHRAIRTSTSATSYAVGAENVVNYASHEVVSSGAGMAFSNPFGTLPTTSGMMLPLFIRYKNTSGGPITPTFGTQFKALGVSVANNEAAGWHFLYEPSLQCFVQIGSAVAYAS